MKVIRAIGDNIVNRKDNIIAVTLRFSDRCNYKCSYCTYHDNSLPFESLDYYFNYVDQVFNNLKHKDEIHVYIHGGEPTIIPNFKKIIQHILSYKNVENIIIQTNTSQPLSYFKDFVELNSKVDFSCSYQHHMNSDFEIYYQKVKYLRDNNLLYVINLSLEDNNIPEICEIIKRINVEFNEHVLYNYIKFKNNVYEQYKSVWYILEEVHITDKEYAVEVFFDNASSKRYLDYNTLRQDGYTSYKYFTCTAGNKNLVIQPNGDVFYCLSDEMFGKPTCNIFTNNQINEISQKNIICMFNKCVCELWLEKKSLFYKKEVFNDNTNQL